MPFVYPQYRHTQEEESRSLEDAIRTFQEHFVQEVREKILSRKMAQIETDEMYGRKLPTPEEFKDDVESSLQMEMTDAASTLAKILLGEVSIG